jgi:hypothetical protein
LLMTCWVIQANWLQTPLVSGTFLLMTPWVIQATWLETPPLWSQFMATTPWVINARWLKTPPVSGMFLLMTPWVIRSTRLETHWANLAWNSPNLEQIWDNDSLSQWLKLAQNTSCCRHPLVNDCLSPQPNLAWNTQNSEQILGNDSPSHSANLSLKGLHLKPITLHPTPRGMGVNPLSISVLRQLMTPSLRTPCGMDWQFCEGEITEDDIPSMYETITRA